MARIDGTVLWRGFEPEEEEEKRQSGASLAWDRAKDLGIDAARGVVGLGEGVVGLAGMVSPSTRQENDAFLKDVGYRPQETHAFLSDYYSAPRKAAMQDFEQAEGAWEGAKAIGRYPGLAIGGAVQSAPQMVGGMAGARLASRAPQLGAALGEGAMAAGGISEAIRQENPDANASPYALAAGAGTAVLSRVGARFGGGIEAAMGARAAARLEGSLIPRVAKATVVEALEEAPQSYQEQVMQNLALGKPWDQDAGKSAVFGAASGGVTGAGISPFRGPARGGSMLPRANPPIQEGGDMSRVINDDGPGPMPPPGFTPPTQDGNVPTQSGGGGGGALPGVAQGGPGTLPPGVAQERAEAQGALPLLEPGKPGKPQPPPPPSVEERTAIFDKYGQMEPLTHDGTKEGRPNGFTWLGKTYSADQGERLEKDVNKAAEEDRAKPPHVLKAEAALLDAYRYMNVNGLKEGSKKPMTPASLKSMMLGVGLASAENESDVIDRIQSMIRIEKATKKSANPSPRGELLERMLEVYTGAATASAPAAPATPAAAIQTPTQAPEALPTEKQLTTPDDDAAALGPVPPYVAKLTPQQKFDGFMEMVFGTANNAIKAVLVDRMSHEKAALIPGKNGKTVARQRIGQLVNKDGNVKDAIRNGKKVKDAMAALGLSDNDVNEYLRPTTQSSLDDVALTPAEAALAENGVVSNAEPALGKSLSAEETSSSKTGEGAVTQSIGIVSSAGGSQGATKGANSLAGIFEKYTKLGNEEIMDRLRDHADQWAKFEAATSSKDKAVAKWGKDGASKLRKQFETFAKGTVEGASDADYLAGAEASRQLDKMLSSPAITPEEKVGEESSEDATEVDAEVKAEIQARIDEEVAKVKVKVKKQTKAAVAEVKKEVKAAKRDFIAEYKARIAEATPKPVVPGAKVQPVKKGMQRAPKAEEIKAKQAEQDARAAQDIELVRQTRAATHADRAAKLWDAAAMEGKPAFVELPETLQKEWVDSVRDGNDTLADQQRVFEMIPKPANIDEDGGIAPAVAASRLPEAVLEVAAAKARSRMSGFSSKPGYDYQALKEAVKTRVWVPLEALQVKPNVATALADMRAAGLGHITDAITNWGLARLPDGFPAVIEFKPNGEYNLILSTEALNDPMLRVHVLHELSHRMDEIGVTASSGMGGLYSRDFGFSVVNGKVMSSSKMGKELLDMWENSGEASWMDFFDYPFNRTKYPTLDIHQINIEAFAQISSMWLLGPKQHEIISRRTPALGKFMLGVINDAQENQPMDLSPQSAGQEAANLRPVATSASGPAQGRNNQGATPAGAPAGRVPLALDTRPAEKTPVGTLGWNEFDKYGGFAPSVSSRVQALGIRDRAKQRLVSEGVIPALNKGLAQFRFLHDFADAAAKQGMASVKRYADLMSLKDGLRARYEAAVEAVGYETNRVGKEQYAAINRFLAGAAQAGTWGYQPANHADVEIDPQQKAAFDLLPSSSQEIVERIFEHGFKSLKARQTVLDREINAAHVALMAASDPAEKPALEKKFRDARNESQKILTSLKGPYSPLKRFGDHVVIAKSAAFLAAEAAKATTQLDEMKGNPTHYNVEFVHGNAAAQARARELAGLYPNGRVEGFEKEEHLRQTDEYQWSILQRMKNRAQNDTALGEQDPAIQRAVMRAVSDMYIHSLSEASARKNELRRRKVPGADPDMIQAFLTQGKADAHFLSALTHNSQIEAEIQNARNEADLPGDDKPRRKQILNELLARHAKSFEDNSGEIQETAMQVTSLSMLLLNPAYYLQNMTQPYLMSMPMMAARFGLKASTQLSEAMLDVGRTWENLKVGFDLNTHRSKVGDERKMLDSLVAANLVNLGIEQDLGQPERGILGQKFQSMMHKFSTGVRHVEKINRAGTALAAFRLDYADAVANGKTPAAAQTQATKYATDVVRRTHGDYSASNAPRFFQGRTRKLVLQFRKFQLIQVELFARTLKTAFADADPEERYLAKKQLAWLVGTHGMAAGALGVPAFKWGVGLLQLLFGAGDDPEDEEEYLTRLIGDKDWARLLLRGVPAWAGVDVSGKVGATNMLSIFPYVKSQFTDDGAKTVKDYLLAAMGPSAAVATRVGGGVSDIAHGDVFKGIEAMLPRGLKDMMKAWRFANEGVTDKTGAVAMTAEEVSFIDALSVALGLPSNKIAERDRVAYRLKDYEQAFQNSATDIKRDYTRAVKNKDSAAAAEARREWATLQETRVRNGFKKQPLSELVRAPIAQKRRERTAINGVLVNRNARGFVRQRTDDDEDD